MLGDKSPITVNLILAMPLKVAFCYSFEGLNYSKRLPILYLINTALWDIRRARGKNVIPPCTEDTGAMH